VASYADIQAIQAMALTYTNLIFSGSLKDDPFKHLFKTPKEKKRKKPRLVPVRDENRDVLFYYMAQG
jgi:uncharacterized membrane-anchored protein YhcB (DUF1043 family)